MPKGSRVARLVDDLTNIQFSVRALMRYETLGDWNDFGNIEVYAGLTKREQLAVGIHELIEMVLLHLQGIRQQDVDKWDFAESGGEYDANMYSRNELYAEAHAFAEMVEKKIIETAGLTWKDYSEKMDFIRPNFTPPSPEVIRKLKFSSLRKRIANSERMQNAKRGKDGKVIRFEE